jgi:5-methylcytosine-specific restriction endonuclease McrA
MKQNVSMVTKVKTKSLSLSVTINCVGCGEVFYGSPTQVWKSWTAHLSKCDLGLEELQWSILRTAVLKRDNYTCQDCGHRWFQGMHVHHRVFRRNGGEDAKSNLVTLCRPCHVKRHRPWKYPSQGKRKEKKENA